MHFDAARIRHPFWDCEFALLANAASEKATNLRSQSGIGLNVMVVCLWTLASWSKRFASNRSLTHAWLILAWIRLSFAERSGRVLVAAYWMLPTKPPEWLSFLNVLLSNNLKNSRKTQNQHETCTHTHTYTLANLDSSDVVHRMFSCNAFDTHRHPQTDNALHKYSLGLCTWQMHIVLWKHTMWTETIATYVWFIDNVRK